MSHLVMVTDNKRPQMLPVGNYTSKTCMEMFGEGYEVEDNLDLGNLYSSSVLILNTGEILYDWKHLWAEGDDGGYYYIESNGHGYDETVIVYEIQENHLKNWTNDAPKLSRFEVLAGGNDNGDSPGIRRIRENMRMHSARSKRLYDARQARNKKVK